MNKDKSSISYDQFYSWVTSGYKNFIDIQRTKSRIVETNEIFTSLDIVLYGLEHTYPVEHFKDPNIKYCDSCAGEGAWLVGMALKRMQHGMLHEDAISNLFSIDLMDDNREATIIRLLCNQTHLRERIESNFVSANGLRYHRRWDNCYPYDDELKKQQQEERFDSLFDSI